MEFLGVKPCFFWSFQGQSKKPKNSRGAYKKVYPQPPFPISCFFFVFFSGISLKRCQFCNFDQWQYARWCIRYATVFIETLRNGRNWANKLILLAHFKTFLFILSYTLWVTPQDFAKWKTLFRYISVISFFRIAFVVVKLKIF